MGRELYQDIGEEEEQPHSEFAESRCCRHFWRAIILSGCSTVQED